MTIKALKSARDFTNEVRGKNSKKQDPCFARLWNYIFERTWGKLKILRSELFLPKRKSKFIIIYDKY